MMPTRNSATPCDRERNNNPSVLQSLSIVSNARLLAKIPDSSGHATRVDNDVKELDAQIEERYLLALGRRRPAEGLTTCHNYASEGTVPLHGIH